VSVYKLAMPMTVGDLANRISIDQLELVSISLNFEPFYTGQATPIAILSIVLLHRASGWKETITYQDGSALAFWTAHAPVLEAAILAKLMADAKLPAGTVA
jgi:hypothetical protein